MKKFVKRLLLILFIFVVVAVIALVAIASLFEDRVGRLITKEINKQLITELQVQDFDLSILRTFPSAGANLQGVRLMGRNDEALLEAEEMSFRFKLLSLLGSNLKVNSVVISNGALNVQIDKRGRANYDVFLESEEASGGSDTDIDLEQARLEDIELIYRDMGTRQEVAALVEEATFSGNFSSDQFALKSTAELLVRFADLDGVRYLPGKAVSYGADIAVDLKEGIYKLQSVTVDVEGNAFRLDGTVESWDTGTYLDLFLSNDEGGQLVGIINLLPAEYLESFEGLTTSGQFALTGLVKGQYNQKQNPEIRLELSMEDGKLASDALESPLKDVRFSAVFTNGKYRDNSSSSFTISDFRGYFDRELVEMRLRASNFDNPEIDFFLDGVVPLKTTYGLLGNPNITAGRGELEIQALAIEGSYEDMVTPSRIDRVKATGTLEFDDAGLTINEEDMLVDRGRLTLEGNRLAIDGLRIQGAGSDVSFKGYAYNVLPVLFADSLNTKRVELEFDASLIAEKMDLDRLIGLATLSEEEEQAPEPVKDSIQVASVQERSRITSFLKGAFNAKINDFNFEKIVGSDFDGTLEFDNRVMNIRGRVNAFDGRLDVDGQAYFEEAPRLTARINCEQLDVYRLFEQAENFYQEVLQAKHLRGRMDAKVAIYAYWDEEGEFMMDKLRVLAGMDIKNGELRDFEMMEEFSTYVNIKDLQRIKFVDLQHFMEIRNERFYLPAMFIRSNALNMTVSGEHTFEHDIKYNIKVNAAQVMADRFKRHDANLKPKPAKRNGWFNLYYTVRGNLDDYNIQSDKRRVRSDFELSEIRKREIKTALQREFGAIPAVVEEPAEWEDGEEEYIDFGG